MFDLWLWLEQQSQEKHVRRSRLNLVRLFNPGLSVSVGERPDEAWHCTVEAYQQQPMMTY